MTVTRNKSRRAGCVENTSKRSECKRERFQEETGKIFAVTKEGRGKRPQRGAACRGAPRPAAPRRGQSSPCRDYRSMQLRIYVERIYRQPSILSGIVAWPVPTRNLIDCNSIVIAPTRVQCNTKQTCLERLANSFACRIRPTVRDEP